MKNALIGRDGYGARGIDDAIDVARADLFLTNRNDAMRVQAANVTASDTREDGVDLTTGHELGFLDGALNRLHGRLDIDDDAALEPA